MMNMINKMKSFIAYNRHMKLLMVETFFYLAFGRLFKLMPFSKASQMLGNKMEETSFEYRDTDRVILKNISDAIRIMSKYTFWESQCLVKAVAAMKMLERRNIESTIYLGTAKDETGELIAHAWLRSGPFYLTGSEGKERFIVVAKFAKQLRYTMKA